MVSLTSSGLVVVAILLAASSLAGVVWITTRPTALHRRLRRVSAVLALGLIGQASAVLATGLVVNTQYDFYTSWNDLLGTAAPPVAISTGGLVMPGSGRLELFRVPTPGVRDSQVMAWLPPEYDLPQYSHQRFPVVVFLPGSPGTPDATFAAFRFANHAMPEILSGRVPPFVALFPTLTVDPPRDTECTNIPGGPSALNWLARAVPRFVVRHLRVAAQGRNWSVMGWSTGGFCAAKLLLTNPQDYSSAVGFGAYYEPLEDATTGRLFGGSSPAADAASPLWSANSPLSQYRQHGLGADHLLVIAGKQDIWSWPSSAAMGAAARSDSAVSTIFFPVGGHNFRDYRVYLGPALDWAAKFWTFGAPLRI